MPFPDSTACFRPQENGQLLTKFDRFTTIPRQISTEIAPVSPLTMLFKALKSELEAYFGIEYVSR